jgi:hypothetical protein
MSKTEDKNGKRIVLSPAERTMRLPLKKNQEQSSEGSDETTIAEKDQRPVFWLPGNILAFRVDASRDDMTPDELRALDDFFEPPDDPNDD